MWIVNTFKPYRYNKYYYNKDKVDKQSEWDIDFCELNNY